MYRFRTSYQSIEAQRFPPFTWERAFLLNYHEPPDTAFLTSNVIQAQEWPVKAVRLDRMRYFYIRQRQQLC